MWVCFVTRGAGCWFSRYVMIQGVSTCVCQTTQHTGSTWFHLNVTLMLNELWLNQIFFIYFFLFHRWWAGWRCEDRFPNWSHDRLQLDFLTWSHLFLFSFRKWNFNFIVVLQYFLQSCWNLPLFLYFLCIIFTRLSIKSFKWHIVGKASSLSPQPVLRVESVTLNAAHGRSR